MDGPVTPFLNLRRGVYTLAAELQGFKKFSSSGNKLNANSTITLDRQLSVGAATETVEVTDTVSQLQTESGAVQNNIDSTNIQGQELHGGNPLYMASLLPGVRSGRTLGDFNFSLSTNLNANLWRRSALNSASYQEEFLVVVGEGVSIGEYQMIRFREHRNSREFRMKTGGVFHQPTGNSYDDQEFTSKRLPPAPNRQLQEAASRGVPVVEIIRKPIKSRKRIFGIFGDKSPVLNPNQSTPPVTPEHGLADGTAVKHCRAKLNFLSST